MKTDYQEIKYNEVRVNNFLFETGDGVQDPKLQTVQIKELRGGNNYRFYIETNNEDLIGSDFLAPIIITEKWLKEFGFKKGKYYWKLEFNDFTIEFDLHKDIVDCFLESIGVDIIYVHQLQNLYFALTGEELPTDIEHHKL